MVGQAIVQVAGNAMRMKADVFKRSVPNRSQFHNLLLRYTLALMNLISRSVACNSLHSTVKCCARIVLLLKLFVNLVLFVSEVSLGTSN